MFWGLIRPFQSDPDTPWGVVKVVKDYWCVDITKKQAKKFLKEYGYYYNSGMLDKWLDANDLSYWAKANRDKITKDRYNLTPGWYDPDSVWGLIEFVKDHFGVKLARKQSEWFLRFHSGYTVYELADYLEKLGLGKVVDKEYFQPEGSDKRISL